MKPKGTCRLMLENWQKVSQITGYPLDVVADFFDAIAEVNEMPEEPQERDEWFEMFDSAFTVKH